MAQLLLSGASLSARQLQLSQALQLLETRLAAWASNTGSYNALLLQVFGAQNSEATAALQSQLSGTGLAIALEILPATSLNGSYAAYTSSDPTAPNASISMPTGCRTPPLPRSRRCCSRSSAMPSITGLMAPLTPR